MRGLVGLLAGCGLAAMAVAVAAAMPLAPAPHARSARHAHDLKFRVTYAVQDIRWGSNWVCLPACQDYGGYHAIHERAEFSVGRTTGSAHGWRMFGGTEYDVQIPRTGAVAPIQDDGPMENGIPESTTPTEGDLWQVYGSVWNEKNPNKPVDCSANNITDAPHSYDGKLLSPGSLLGKNLSFDIAIHGDSASGAIYSPGIDIEAGPGTKLHDCAAFANRWPIFYPVSSAYFALVDGGHAAMDMLSSHLTVSLATLRKMKVGDHYGWTFHEGKALFHPPGNCTKLTGATCNESLHWTGSILFVRTA